MMKSWFYRVKRGIFLSAGIGMIGIGTGWIQMRSDIAQMKAQPVQRSRDMDKQQKKDVRSTRTSLQPTNVTNTQLSTIHTMLNHPIESTKVNTVSLERDSNINLATTPHIIAQNHRRNYLATLQHSTPSDTFPVDDKSAIYPINQENKNDIMDTFTDTNYHQIEYNRTKDSVADTTNTEACFSQTTTTFNNTNTDTISHPTSSTSLVDCFSLIVTPYSQKLYDMKTGLEQTHHIKLGQCTKSSQCAWPLESYLHNTLRFLYYFGASWMRLYIPTDIHEWEYHYWKNVIQKAYDESILALQTSKIHHTTTSDVSSKDTISHSSIHNVQTNQTENVQSATVKEEDLSITTQIPMQVQNEKRTPTKASDLNSDADETPHNLNPKNTSEINEISDTTCVICYQPKSIKECFQFLQRTIPAFQELCAAHPLIPLEQIKSDTKDPRTRAELDFLASMLHGSKPNIPTQTEIPTLHVVVPISMEDLTGTVWSYARAQPMKDTLAGSHGLDVPKPVCLYELLAMLHHHIILDSPSSLFQMPVCFFWKEGHGTTEEAINMIKEIVLSIPIHTLSESNSDTTELDDFVHTIVHEMCGKDLIFIHALLQQLQENSTLHEQITQKNVMDITTSMKMSILQRLRNCMFQYANPTFLQDWTVDSSYLDKKKESIQSNSNQNSESSSDSNQINETEKNKIKMDKGSSNTQEVPMWNDTDLKTSQLCSNIDEDLEQVLCVFIWYSMAKLSGLIEDTITDTSYNNRGMINSMPLRTLIDFMSRFAPGKGDTEYAWQILEIIINRGLLTLRPPQMTSSISTYDLNDSNSLILDQAKSIDTEQQKAYQGKNEEKAVSILDWDVCLCDSTRLLFEDMWHRMTPNMPAARLIEAYKLRLQIQGELEQAVIDSESVRSESHKLDTAEDLIRLHEIQDTLTEEQLFGYKIDLRLNRENVLVKEQEIQGRRRELEKLKLHAEELIRLNSNRR